LGEKRPCNVWLIKRLFFGGKQWPKVLTLWEIFFWNPHI
jgi:hypothetical protein